MEHRIATLNDKISDMDRVNMSLKDQVSENDSMMARFADEIRQMDVEVDRRRREQEALEGDNRRLKEDLDDLRHLQAKFDQTRVTLDEEAARRVASEAEADRLRAQLAGSQS